MADPSAQARAALPNFPRVVTELATLSLLRCEAEGAPGACPALIVAPYAVHDAGIADFAPGHSLAEALLGAGLAPLALIAWKSASADMRDLGVDAFLSDLNVAVDDLGGRAILIGLCQGGWLAALYAARFPAKVASLALAGAPLDLKAEPSAITRALALAPPALIEGLVAMCGGRVYASASFGLAGQELSMEYEPARALQCEPDTALRARFADWRGRGFTLPGRYYLQTAEWLFRENRLAENSFPALGRLTGLTHVAAPTFALAARDDRIAAPKQATPLGEATVVDGGHLCLFVGRRTLTDAWPAIARRLRETALPRANSSQAD